MNTDASVRRLKGEGRPVQNENDRAEVLSSLGCVDFVVLFGEETPYELIKSIKPDVLVKGGDWPVEKIVGHDVVKALGGQTLSLKFHRGHSTTSILEKIIKL
jgi:rfaE bifunctional protein nucleotidyltransferase chain/domain